VEIVIERIQGFKGPSGQVKDSVNKGTKWKFIGFFVASGLSLPAWVPDIKKAEDKPCLPAGRLRATKNERGSFLEKRGS